MILPLINMTPLPTLLDHFKNKPAEGSKKFQVRCREANWYIISEENKALFVGKPEKYAPQYGGWCAYAMSDEGRTLCVDEDAFHIYQGKLF